MTKLIVKNNYKIKYNPLFKEYSASHDLVVCREIKGGSPKNP